MRAFRVAFFALAVAALVLGPSDAQARYEGNLNLFAGAKWLRTPDWEPVDEQQELGLMFAFGEERAAVHFAIDVFVSKADALPASPAADSIVRGSSAELALGIRKVWVRGATRPHMGAGATAFRVHQDLEGPSGNSKRSDQGYGVWVEAGISWRIAGHLNLGIEVRYSSGTVDLGAAFVPRDVAAGGVHAGVLIGYGW